MDTGDKSLRQTLADNMRMFREKKNLSQEIFAEMCKLHRTYISDIERCKRNVSIDNIEKIATALGISASTLLRENSDENC